MIYDNKIRLSKLAKKMKIAAREDPLAEDTNKIPHPKHWANLPNGLRLCFTLNLLDEPLWHLSISSAYGDISEEEITKCIKAFFDISKTIEVTEGTINKGVLHFWQTAEGITIN